MARLTNALLQAGQAYGNGHQAPMLDLGAGGGMFGWDVPYGEWVSNQAYIKKDIIALVVEAPKGFQYLPNPEMWVGTFRSLIELHSESIDGLARGLEVDVSERAVGGAGEMQEDVTNVTRVRTQVTYKWTEKYGMPVFNFHEGWITQLLMDPNTKMPLITTASGSKPSDALADMYSATIMYIEPDPMHQKVMKAWLVTNQFPKATGENIGRKDKTSASEVTTYDIPYAGIAQIGAGVDSLAQAMLNTMSLTGANPYMRAAFVDQIAADVARGSKSYSQGISELENAAVRL